MIKILLGGSPCTHWSIAQKNNRETKAEGIGWELFKNYLIAKEKFQPDFFLYENNKSAAQAIKDQIAEELGVGTDPQARFTYINSALVSAQNRQRFYVTNFGDIEQPADRGILLKDILESGVMDKEKAYCLKHQAGNARDYFKKHHTQIAYEPVPFGENNEGKAYCLDANYHKGLPANKVLDYRQRTMVAEPVCLRYERSDEAKRLRKQYEAGEIHHGFNELNELHPRTDGKSNTLSTVLKDNPICEPVRLGHFNKGGQGDRIYSMDGKSICLSANGGGRGAKTGLYAIPTLVIKENTQKGYIEVKCGDCFDYEMPSSKTRRGRDMSDKANCLTTSCNFYQYFAYATDFDDNGTPTKAISCADGKTYAVYCVKDGKITIKDKQYPIKLIDGYYIIRKLTVNECCRLQTMPDNYCKAVSDTQGYKGLGNGWTAEVIIHLLNHALNDIAKDEEIIVLSMYDGIGTGRYCLDKMGFTNVTYYAYEIDKYAMTVSNDNYPDIIQCGDAFAVRQDDWEAGNEKN